MGHVTGSGQSEASVMSVVVGIDDDDDGHAPPGKRGVALLKGTYQEKLSACRLPGQRPLRGTSLKLSKKLDLFPVPDNLRLCVEENDDVMAEEPTLEEVRQNHTSSFRDWGGGSKYSGISE